MKKEKEREGEREKEEKIFNMIDNLAFSVGQIESLQKAIIAFCKRLPVPWPDERSLTSLRLSLMKATCIALEKKKSLMTTMAQSPSHKIAF